MTTGICECGCGGLTAIAKQSHTGKGWTKGVPLRFVRGHARRNKRDRPLESMYTVDANGCWLWQNSKSWGYGYVSPLGGGLRVRAHRFMYERLVGPIAEGLTLDHLCRVRHCVNPAHLEPVTIRENTLRGNTISGMNAKKTHCLRGHPLSGDNLRKIGGRSNRSCKACSKIRDEGYRKHRSTFEPAAAQATRTDTQP